MDSSNKFIIHAIILAVSGFVSRIIGIIYAIPLYHIIGEEGNGYYGTAYEIYNMFLLITAYSMPIAMSKIMAVYIGEKDYVNCDRLFRCSLFYVTVVGGVAGLAIYFLGKYFVIEHAVMTLKVMAPTIFISGYLSVLRGYMQAHGTMIPTAISQVVEQLVNAFLSIFFAYIFMQNANSSPAALGAVGSAVGTLGGVVVALMLMLGFYAVKSRKIRKTMIFSGDLLIQPERESYFSLIRVIFIMVCPIIFTTFIYNLSTVIDMQLFWWWSSDNQVPLETSASIYGIYSRQYLVLINLPIAIASAISSAMMPDLASVFRDKKSKIAEAKISKAVRTVLFVAIPSVVGYIILAQPIMQFLFKGTWKDAAYALAAGAISIIFFSVSTVLNTALQGMNKSGATILNVVKALLIHVAYVAGMLKVSDKPMEVLVSGSVIYSFVVCSANVRSIEKLMQARINIRDMFLKPIITSLIMGFVTILSYNGVRNFGAGNAIALIAAIIIGMLTYFALMARGKSYTDRTIFTTDYEGIYSRKTLPKILNMLKLR